MKGIDSAVDAIRAAAFRVPTSTDGRIEAESDGTATWDSTGVLVVEVSCGDETGIGYSYTAGPAALQIVRDPLAPTLLAQDAMATTAAFWKMARSVRNLGWSGVAAAAVSALDIAAHDLKAKLMGAPLVDLLGSARSSVQAYGSGGFTNYTDAQLSAQLEEWVGRGFRAVKMKVGSEPARDPHRVGLARRQVGDDVSLFVDANGAYSRKTALGLADVFARDADVSWFEEPVSSRDLVGLRLIRDRAPAGMDIAAGEYGYTPEDFALLLQEAAVDTLQADATRCGGVTGFLLAAALCAAADTPLSAHTAPALHAVLGCSAQPVVHVESFHDHEIVESLLFDGLPAIQDGHLIPSRERPGHGLERSGRGTEYLQAEWSSE